MSGKLFVVTGPSGAGKTTVTDLVIKQTPQTHRLITCTSRPIREKETDGIDYHFFDRPAFEKMIAGDAMVEWDEHYGNLYGIRKSDVEKRLSEGNATVVCTDIAGAKTLKRLYPESIVIFLTAESPAVLEARIRGRGMTSEVDVKTRLDRLPEELAYAKEADYVVTNVEGHLDQTVANIAEIIHQELAKT